VLVLIGVRGLSYEQAAEICGCEVGTVKSRLSRAERAPAVADPQAPCLTTVCATPQAGGGQSPRHHRRGTGVECGALVFQEGGGRPSGGLTTSPPEPAASRGRARRAGATSRTPSREALGRSPEHPAGATATGGGAPRPGGQVAPECGAPSGGDTQHDYSLSREPTIPQAARRRQYAIPDSTDAEAGTLLPGGPPATLAGAQPELPPSGLSRTADRHRPDWRRLLAGGLTPCRTAGACLTIRTIWYSAHREPSTALARAGGAPRTAARGADR
jgi:hypothetical protein